MQKIELTLPEWVFWDAHSHDGNPLGNRTIIEHVRSASVFEIFDRDFEILGLNPDVLTFKFRNNGLREEKLLLALHHSCTLDSGDQYERGKLLDIMKRCAIWYCDYCDWEDNQNYLL